MEFSKEDLQEAKRQMDSTPPAPAGWSCGAAAILSKTQDVSPFPIPAASVEWKPRQFWAQSPGMPV